MRILFVTTGVGLGHSTRDEAVIAKIREKHPSAKIHIAAFDLAHAYFKDKFACTEIVGLRLPEKKFHFGLLKTIVKNWSFPVIWLKTFFRLRRLIKRFKPEKVVIDFEPVGALAARSCKTDQIALFNYDPKLFAQYWKKHPSLNLLIQSLYFQVTYNLIHGKKIITSFFKSGFKDGYYYVPLIVRKEKKRMNSEKSLLRRLDLKKGPILISFGGSSIGMFLIDEMIKLVEDFGDEEFIFFCNRDLKGKNYSCRPFSENFLEYLHVCKGIITLAGHSTLSEVLAYRKPALMYPVPHYIEQELNCFYFEYHRIGLVRRYRKKMDIKQDIADFIREIPSLQKKMNALKIQTDGAEKAAALIMN